MQLVSRLQTDGIFIIIDNTYVGNIMEGEFFQEKACYIDTEFVIS